MEGERGEKATKKDIERQREARESERERERETDRQTERDSLLMLRYAHVFDVVLISHSFV